MNRACSIFSQMLQLFSRAEFERAVVEHRAERHARGFSCWGQFVAMLFCHLGRAQSLREICGGLAASEGKLRHLGLPDAPKRSTLAYANEHRPWQLYRSVFCQLLARCREARSPIYLRQWVSLLFGRVTRFIGENWSCFSWLLEFSALLSALMRIFCCGPIFGK
jgi:Domain of unknown function (DUF4372)